MHNFSYLRVMSMGGHFFPKWICMAMIFEPYLGCYSSIFSQTLVYCSWDYGLSAESSSILNQMSGTWSNIDSKCDKCQKHITLICQHDKLPLVRNCFCMKNTQTISLQILWFIYLKNKPYNHVQIFTVYLASLGIVHLLFSVWSLNHDVIQVPFCVFTWSFISS